MDEKLKGKKYHFGKFGGFLALFEAHRDALSDPKKVNDEVSCDGICKFEIGTIKTTIKTCIMKFWTNIKKSPQRGVLALKVPKGHEPVFPGSAIKLLCS